MTDTERSKTTVTHTETSVNGSVVVITDVPAYVFDEDGEHQTVYDMNVALKIDDFVASVFEGNSEPNRIFAYSYQHLDAGSRADAQIKMTGSARVDFYSATTQIWKESVDSIYRSISLLQVALESVFISTKIADPVLIPGHGSLLFNLYAKEPSSATQEPLSFFGTPRPPELQVLELLMASYNYVVDDQIYNELISEFPQLKIATLKAIESLSPRKGSDIEQVQIVPTSESLSEFRPVTLTKATREMARNKRSWLEGGSEPSDVRQVEIIGQVAQVSRDGSFTIRDIELNYPEDKKYPTKALYYPHLFEELVDLFKKKKRVRFSGIEYRRNNKWDSEPNIRAVKEAPPPAEVPNIREEIASTTTMTTLNPKLEL